MRSVASHRAHFYGRFRPIEALWLSDDDMGMTKENRWPRPGRMIQRWLALGCTLTLVWLITRYPQPRSVRASGAGESLDHLASSHLRHLASPLHPVDHKGLEVAHQQSYYVLGDEVKVDPAYPDDYQWIDSETRTYFEGEYRRFGNTNVAMARLPPGSGYDAVAVARGWTNLYKGESDDSLRNTTIVGFFLNYDPAAKEWRGVGPAPYVLDLPVLRQDPRPCLDRVEAGPEDPRLLWTDHGQLLLTLGTTSQVRGVCRSMAIVDLRVVWHGFTDLMKRLGYSKIPVELDAVTEIAPRGDKDQYEKNWAPFFPGASARVLSTRARMFLRPVEHIGMPLFHTHVVPQTIMGLAIETEIDAPAFESAASTSSSTKTAYMEMVEQRFEEIPSDWLANQSARVTQCLTSTILGFALHDFHQATPYHRVTMCPRGQCIPDSTNTVLFGIGHLKIDWNTYRRFFMTLSVDAPHRIISVSKPVHLGERKLDKQVIFALSTTFYPVGYTFSRPSSPAHEAKRRDVVWDSSAEVHLGHGWLDDTLVIGAGMKDFEMASFHMPLATALKGHHLCG